MMFLFIGTFMNIEEQDSRVIVPIYVGTGTVTGTFINRGEEGGSSIDLCYIGN